nr:MAG TPA: hypothetical protein [Caudoviricetes sp.]
MGFNSLTEMKNTPLLVANNAVLAVSVRVWCSSRV